MTAREFLDRWGHMIDSTSQDGCWVWNGPMHMAGRPKSLDLDGRHVPPAKGCYEAFYTCRVEGLVRRACATKGCIRPEHQQVRGRLVQTPSGRQTEIISAGSGPARRLIAEIVALGGSVYLLGDAVIWFLDPEQASPALRASVHQFASDLARFLSRDLPKPVPDDGEPVA
jgi:hypothetical protein